MGSKMRYTVFMSIVVTKSEKETKTIAALFAKDILDELPLGKKATVIALSGNLGAGKTTFAQGFAKGLGVREKIKSPTFVLMRAHKLNVKCFQYFYHIDCWRLESAKEAAHIGLKEILADPHNLVLIEWAEKIKKALPKKIITVKFIFLNEKTRKLYLSHT